MIEMSGNIIVLLHYTILLERWLQTVSAISKLESHAGTLRPDYHPV